jgi:hypothetical protein
MSASLLSEQAADITQEGDTDMKSVYERKAYGKVRGTWMDRFMQLEPEGGFRAVVELARSHRASTPNEAYRPTSLAA